MNTGTASPPRGWTVAEAKARLSAILRLMEEEGRQRIGVRKWSLLVRFSDALLVKPESDEVGVEAGAGDLEPSG